MANKAMVDFEADVEKLVATYVQGANNAIEGAKKQVQSRIDDLVKALGKLKAPVDQDALITNTVNVILSRESKQIEAAVSIGFAVRIDKDLKLKPQRVEIKGQLFKL